MGDNRNRAILIALLVSAVLLAHTTQAQEKRVVRPEEVGVSSDKVNELSRFMQSLVDQGKIAGGVTLMARRGKVVHLNAVGMADREAKKPMNTDAIFRIASMTKPITTVAIMMLYEKGKLDLDHPLSNYLPEFKNPEVLVRVKPLETRPAKREITIRPLLTHTAGLTYGSPDSLGTIYNEHGISPPTTKMNLEQMTSALAALPLLFDPGDRYEYGMSTDVLGRVVEVVSGMPLDDFFSDNIFKPLDMNDTFFEVPAEKRHRLVAAYTTTDTGIRKLPGEQMDYPYSESHKYLSGGGGLASTASDYLRFCQMLLNGGELDGVRLLREQTVKLMTAKRIGEKEGFVRQGGMDLPGGFGLGFHVLPNSKDMHAQLRNAYAWFGLFSTSFRIAPHGDWILITMAQVIWDESLTPAWMAKYEQIAAESILD